MNFYVVYVQYCAMCLIIIYIYIYLFILPTNMQTSRIVHNVLVLLGSKYRRNLARNKILST
jgi:hypothetical protein